MIEGVRVKTKAVLQASLSEVKRNTSFWNDLHGLGLIPQREVPGIVIWSTGNCLIIAREVREDTTEVYLVVARRQPGYNWVYGFHPDLQAIPSWNRLAQLWMEAHWSQGVRSFENQWRVISEEVAQFAEQNPPPNEMVLRGYVEYTLRRKYASKDRDVPKDEFEGVLNLEWIILRREIEQAQAFRREQEATPDLSNEEMVVAFLPMLQTQESAQSPQAASDAADGHEKETAECFVFRKQGEMWKVVNGTGKEFHLKDMKGLSYIAYLLRNPQREYRILELVSAVEWEAVADADISHASLSGQELKEQGLHVSDGTEATLVYDQTTKDTLAKRLKQLIVDRAQAEGDPQELAKIDEETGQIEAYLKAGQGLGGRLRKDGSDADSERSRVWHLVNDAIQKIGLYDSDLSEHLKDSIRIQTADSAYKPAEPITWHV